VGQKLRLKSNHKAPATNLSPIADKVVSLAWNQLVTIAKSYAKGSLVVEGEEQLLTQPEFKKDVDTFATLMEELHDSDVLYQSLANSQSGQIVTIGRENPRAELKQFSIVRQSYYVGEDEAGVIAVVGPTRMKYDDGIPLVNFTAAALSESLTRFLGK
jgi:heat-inducible transcriptional repressor